MKNLEDLYTDMLGNPAKGDLRELDKKYSEKLSELSNYFDASRVDISRIQKSGELQNAYLYLKTQWSLKQQRESGLITNQTLPNYQRTRRHRRKGSDTLNKMQKFNLELRRTARAGLILISILSIYQFVNYLINQEAVVASTEFNNNPTQNWDNLVNEEKRIRGIINENRKDISPNFETLPNFNNREIDSPLLIAAKSCNLEQLRNAYKTNKNLNIRNSLGESASHWLSRLNCAEGLKWAIENGANLNLKDNSGRTPIDWARLNNSYESIQIINKNFK